MDLSAGKRAAWAERAAGMLMFAAIPLFTVVFGWVAVTIAIDLMGTNGFLGNQEKLWPGLGAFLFSSFISIGCAYLMWSFARFCYAKKIILQLPRMRIRWDDPVPQRLDRLAIEVLRQNIGKVQSGFISYPLQWKLGEAAVRLLPSAWEHGELSDIEETEKLPWVPNLTLLEKIKHMDPVSGLAAFSDGKVIGQRRIFWDFFFLLGPRYIVVFPSWACASTHADGFYVQK